MADVSNETLLEIFRRVETIMVDRFGHLKYHEKVADTLEGDLFYKRQYHDRLTEVAYFVHAMGISLQTDDWQKVRDVVLDCRQSVQKKAFLERFANASKGISWNGQSLHIESGGPGKEVLFLRTGKQSWTIYFNRMPYLNLFAELLCEMDEGHGQDFLASLVMNDPGGEQGRQAVSRLAGILKEKLTDCYTAWEAMGESPEHLYRRCEAIRNFILGKEELKEKYGDTVQAEDLQPLEIVAFWKEMSLKERNGATSDKGFIQFTTIVELFNKVITVSKLWRDWRNREKTFSLGSDAEDGVIDLEWLKCPEKEEDEDILYQMADMMASQLHNHTILARLTSHGAEWDIKYFMPHDTETDFLKILFDNTPLVERFPTLVAWSRTVGPWQYALSRGTVRCNRIPETNYALVHAEWKEKQSKHQTTLHAILHYLLCHGEVEGLRLFSQLGRQASFIDLLRKSATFDRLWKEARPIDLSDERVGRFAAIINACQEEQDKLNRQRGAMATDLWNERQEALEKARQAAILGFVEETFPLPEGRLGFLVDVMATAHRGFETCISDEARWDSIALFKTLISTMLNSHIVPALRPLVVEAYDTIQSGTIKNFATVQLPKAYESNGFREGFPPKKRLMEENSCLREGHRRGGDLMAELVRKIAQFNTKLGLSLRNDEQYKEDMEMFREHLAKLYPNKAEC
ncbi:MAG: hypothetical protein HQL56_03580 [Magnetococcales bacterium]|nr:hypothetical protein [Magnetococcales bacterium]